ncbi:folylpolyglutamate synthase/dihydrofolate synthase family protein [Thermoactinomyces sp. DSM 45892]|uniref:bifunctional folylpolyglutamate synthase/dihydrofolate synthase n=1 Tax=Thermoactinomyces sp. DSM 45892 TaxID=1882753 RepID=UPI000896C750|nr:folylpolyglutamate synthase/dihydrofolate synthase family protein [Thermoactinomyces sp. DSM 45892]SDY79354.1 dihydrofolate synthase / folylpolyglutamate synthase [Thermoactinomyces sp. DSM 45892]
MDRVWIDAECAEIEGRKRATLFRAAQEVQDWMDQHCVMGIQPGLDRMKWVLARLGHPERRCKWIHIAGTNGKGSTGAMITSILREADYSVGVFLSPHILEWNERIQVDGIGISEESFVQWSNTLLPYLEELVEQGNAPSPFEVWTLVGICYFALDACPWFVVWEAGLGGRWDSTNVVHPLVSVITNIGYDHKEFLGSTLPDIAREKAGIIKRGVPLVSSVEEGDAQSVIHRIAQNESAAIYQLHKQFSYEIEECTANKQVFSFTSPFERLTNLSIGLQGVHQFENAATALMTIDILRRRYITVVEETHIRVGLEKVHWAGRMEKVQDQPLVILDGAHNQDGILSLAASLTRWYPHKKIRFVLASLQDKEIDILKPIVDIAHEIIVTEISNFPRSRRANELATMLTPYFSGTVQAFEKTEDAVQVAVNQANSDDVVVITGSLYLVSEVRPYFVRSI